MFVNHGFAKQIIHTFRQRLKSWFGNHTRASLSCFGARGVLNLNPPAKSVQPWQAYLNKYQNTKLKDKIDDAWQEYLSTVPTGQKPKKTIFEIRNKVAQEQYRAEEADVKQEVEKHREEMKYGTGTTDNKKFQRYARSPVNVTVPHLWVLRRIVL